MISFTLNSSSLAFLEQSDYSQDLVLEQERALVVNARSPSRLVEFGLGRAAARVALKALGVAGDRPILRGLKGEPVWPPGFSGSIAHTRSYAPQNLASRVAIAAVAESKYVRSIGIDIESRLRTVSPDLMRRICLPEEVSWIENAACAQPSSPPAGTPQTPVQLDFDSLSTSERTLVILSAKEALYKLLAQNADVTLRFSDACVHVDKTSARIVMQRAVSESLGKDLALCFEAYSLGEYMAILIALNEKTAD